ncbi:MAG: TolC family protein, partial [Kiritimatiellae bacterium]|nr:TolC family protein [Kiritimatiellia bacterium]
MKFFLPGICLLSIILIPIKSNGLTIEEAVDLALASDPALQAARADVKSAEAEAVLASRWENPELEIEAEGIGGDRESGTAEYTAFISQSIPAFGRTRQSRLAADEAIRAAQALLIHAAMETEVAVRTAYADVQSAAELARITDDYENLAKKAVEASRRKNEAGAIPDRDVLQAEMELEKAGLDKEQAITDAGLAGERLSALLGRAVAETDMATDFYSLPNVDIPDAVPSSHPVLSALDAEIAAAEAERNLAASSSISDIDRKST